MVVNFVDEKRVLDLQTFRRLLEEGQNLRRKFREDAAPMRWLTAEDLKTRIR